MLVEVVVLLALAALAYYLRTTGTTPNPAALRRVAPVAADRPVRYSLAMWSWW